MSPDMYNKARPGRRPGELRCGGDTCPLRALPGGHRGGLPRAERVHRECGGEGEVCEGGGGGGGRGDEGAGGFRGRDQGGSEDRVPFHRGGTTGSVRYIEFVKSRSVYDHVGNLGKLHPQNPQTTSKTCVNEKKGYREGHFLPF